MCVKSYNSDGGKKDFIGIDYVIVGGKRNDQVKIKNGNRIIR